MPFNSLAGRLKDVIVIGPEEPPVVAQLVDEVSEIDVSAAEVVSKGMIQVAAVDEDCYPWVSTNPSRAGRRGVVLVRHHVTL